MDTIHRHDVAAAKPEEKDADLTLVAWTSTGILVFMFVCMGIGVLHFNFEQTEMKPRETSIFTREGKLPPEPRLQAFPAKDLATFQATQQARVETFGWVDKEGGIAHVPVEKGMEMVLQKGFAPLVTPAKPAPGAVKAAAEVKK